MVYVGTCDDVDVWHICRRQVYDLRRVLECHPEHALLGVGPAQPVDADDVEPPALHLLDAALDQDGHLRRARRRGQPGGRHHGRGLALQHRLQVGAEQLARRSHWSTKHALNIPIYGQ